MGVIYGITLRPSPWIVPFLALFPLLPLSILGIIVGAAFPASFHTSFFRTISLYVLDCVMAAAIILHLDSISRSSFEAFDKLQLRRDWLDQKVADADELLGDVLPSPFASELMKFLDSGERVHRVFVQTCTVLWTDLVEFTKWCARKKSPFLVLNFLNGLAEEIDNFCKSNHLMRYKMVGDAFCCISREESETPEYSAVCLGRKIVEFCRRRREAKIRVGIASGSILLTFCHTHERFRSDIFGGPVVRAETLESSAPHFGICVDSGVHAASEKNIVYRRFEGDSWIYVQRKPLCSLWKEKPATQVSPVSPNEDAEMETEDQKGCGPCDVLKEFCKPGNGLCVCGICFAQLKQEASFLKSENTADGTRTSFALAHGIACLHCVLLLLSWLMYEKWEAYTSPSPVMILLSVSTVLHALFSFLSVCIRGMGWHIASSCISQLVQWCIVLANAIYGGSVLPDSEFSFFDVALVPSLCVLFYPTWPHPMRFSVLGFSIVCLGVHVGVRKVPSELQFLMFVMSLLLPLVAMGHEARKRWMSTVSMVEAETGLSEQKTRIDLLVHSIVPKGIGAALQKNDLRGFCVALQRSLVAFIRVLFRKDLHTCLSLAEERLPTLATLFETFDAEFAAIGAVPVKVNCETYIVVMSPDDGERSELLRDFVVALGACREAAVAVPTSAVHIGVGFGNLGGGCVGATYHLFDVWGTPANVAARLSAHSLSSKGILMRTTDYERCGRAQGGIARSVGCSPVGEELSLKGVGGCSCCWVRVISDEEGK